MGETRAELPFIRDQAVCLSHDQAARSGPEEEGAAQMSVELNHTIIPAKDKLISAKFLADTSISRRARNGAISSRSRQRTA